MCKKFICFLVCLFFISSALQAQLREDFTDGNFTSDPVWTGDVEDFVVNQDLQLQSSNEVPGSTFYLSTANSLALETEWNVRVRMAFNPSSVNYIDVYLTASASDLTLATTTGYFVRLGGTDDEISLCKKNSAGGIIKIIEGTRQALNRSDNRIMIRVTRDEKNVWTLLTDISGTGLNFSAEGSVEDTAFSTAAYFGFLVRQSTPGFFKKHFFDDIEIKPFLADRRPPAVVMATAISENSLDILFDEPLNKLSIENPANYFVNQGIGPPAKAELDTENSALIHLTFPQNFSTGVSYSMIIEGVKDLYGNMVRNGDARFSYYTPQRYDVVISEVFPDPAPGVGLPSFKFLELHNVSSHSLNLRGWTISDGTRTAELPAYRLPPDSFVIVTATNSRSAYEPYGATIGVSNFPSMNIGGSTLLLQAASGSVMHVMQYDLSTYHNELKKDGGWSLEMINTKNPCAGTTNWTASTHPQGGTPGKKNAASRGNRDELPPQLLHAFATNEKEVALFFNKSLDSSIATKSENYTFDKGISVNRIEATAPFFDKVILHLEKPVSPAINYSINVKNITDCSGNRIEPGSIASYGLAQPADSLDVVINEILFNPPLMGVDYVELYNRSQKNINLSNLYLANRNSRNIVGSIQQVASDNRLLFPGEFTLLSTDPEIVKSQFMTTNPRAFIKMNSFPSYPNSSGDVVLLNQQGQIIDEVNYREKWHFPLIKNAAGVALERIDYDLPSNASNFHSAAATVGFGTPGYKNSQHLILPEVKGEIIVQPEIFSPDNDGIDDLLTISYQFSSPGYVANITIFDASGNAVRYLQKNSLTGTTGFFRWDGLDDKNRKVPQGIYIIYTEIFNVEGKKRIFKNSVVLARRAGS